MSRCQVVKFIAFHISKFYTISVLTISIKSPLLLVIIVQLHALPTKKLKLPFQKTNLGIQSLYSVGPSIWNNLPDNFKSDTSDFEADIYSYKWTNPHTKLVTILAKQDKCSSNSFSVLISRFFPILSIFSICVFF